MARTTKNNIKKKDEPETRTHVRRMWLGRILFKTFKFGYGRKANFFKMPVCSKSQHDTFGKSVRQMEKETINWSIFKISGFCVRKNTGKTQKHVVDF